MPDGNIIKNEAFINGNGKLFDYYEDGNIFSISNYKDGFLNGSFEEFHPNGKLASQGKYNNNNKVGTWFEYSKRGIKKKRTEYD